MSGRPWTTEEIETLRECYESHGICWDGWAEALPGRTIDSIKQRASKMGLRNRRPWTDSERAIVLAHVMRAAKEIGRTPYTCAHMASKLLRDEAERRRRG